MRLSKKQKCLNEIKKMAENQGSLITTYQIIECMNNFEVGSEEVDFFIREMKKNFDVVDIEEEEEDIWKEINQIKAENEMKTSKEIRSAFDQYYNQIRTIPILSKEEIAKLSETIMTSTDPKEVEKARNELVKHNLRYVVSVAKKFEFIIPRMDAIQEGNIGLMKAAEKFDYRKNTQFLTYATWWISHFIRRAIPNNQKSSSIKYPNYFIQQMEKVKNARTKLQLETGNEYVPVQDIAKEAGLSVNKVIDTLTNMRECSSLDYIISPDDSKGNASVEDVVADENAQNPDEYIETKDLSERVQTWVKETLTEREAKIIFLRLGLGGGEPKTLDEVGKEVDICKERVRQVQAMAMNKLRKTAPRYNINMLYLKED